MTIKPKTVREIRLAKGHSQKSMAAELGVSVTTIQNWETGRRCPTEENEAAIRSLKTRLRKKA
jgi:DNA-binding transcriptional regulator YiaG